MAGKIRHLLYRDGRYYARRIVPQDLRAVVGRNEVREPLGADKRRAIEQLPLALVKINALFEHARELAARREGDAAAARVALASPMSSTELAQAHYQERLALDTAYREAGPSWASISIDDRYVEDLRSVLAGRLSDQQVDAVLGDTLAKYRRRGNLVSMPGSLEWRQAARAVAGAEMEALERFVERDEGIDPAAQVHPPHLTAPADEEPAPFKAPLSLRGLLESHLKALEAQGRGRAGRKAWPRVFEDLLQFLCRHRKLTAKARSQADDARRLTPEELIAWRDEKLTTLAAKTVKDVWLASVKSVLQRAVDDRKLESNPAAVVKLKAESPPRLRSKGFSDGEAVQILQACRDYAPVARENARTMESKHITAAKRWGPWLCAFTGARVTEIMQLRKSDVRQEDGIHYLHITPDAGSVKNRAYRDVPLHPQLVELGFLEFVAASNIDPLFYSSKADPTKRPAEVSSNRLSTWLRSSGLIPEGVAPNHGWRHRFKTQSRDLSLDPHVVDAIQGHAGHTASDGYGDVSLRAKKGAIDRLPPYR